MASSVWNGFVWGEMIVLAVAIALFVILIVVLNRNNLSTTVCDDPSSGCVQEKLTKLDNKVNWLFILEIVAVGLMILAGVLAFFRVRMWTY